MPEFTHESLSALSLVSHVNCTTETPAGPFSPEFFLAVHFFETPNSSSSISASVSEPPPKDFFNFLAVSLAFSAFFSKSSVF